MGAIWSKNEQRASDDGETPTVQSVRGTEFDYAQSSERPSKRQRRSRKSQKSDRAVPPPTRAMQNGLDEQASTTPNGIGSTQAVKEAVTKSTKRKKRKVAVFLGYSGQNYAGMQVNPGVVTIEQLLLTALHKGGLISDANKDAMSKISWMRAARTDKGVSAAGQCVSAKLECEIDNRIDPSLVEAVNQHLPEDVQVYGFLRATAGFNARIDCHRRRYEYMFPVRLLGGCNGVEAETEQGAGDPRAAKLTSILRLYEGTHCFANFTEGLTGSDDAARRYMIRVRCGQPFLPPNCGVYYVTIEVYGQSFLLHQIRKMVGLALLVYLGHAPSEVISVALCQYVKIPTPMAPALGLLLDSLHFENYNNRHRTLADGPITVDTFVDAKETFKVQRIYKEIAEKERMDRTLENWIKSCQPKLQLSTEEILQLHAKFVKSDEGREEQRRAHIASLYPIKTTMEDFLDSSDEEMAQLALSLKKEFSNRYNTDATFLARAPGRVILIGEHLDYNGLPVIAVATAQGTMVAGCLDDTDLIDVEHVENDKFAPGQLRANGLRMASGEDSRGKKDLDSNWLQYVSWGVKALTGSLNSGKRTVKGGGRLLIGGNLPRAGGLGSSSSLVTASALTTARLNRRRIPKKEIALVSAQGERVGAGTKGGAVDHTMSMCGVRGGALMIHFTPHFITQEIKIPDGASLFAVNSGVKAAKGFDLYIKSQYNLRTAECRIGAALLARRLKVHLEKSVTTPGQLLFQARKTSVLDCKTVSVLREKANAVMPVDEVVSLDETREQLGVTEVELQNRYLAGVEADKFHVGKRMAHVFSEAERVEHFAAVMADENMSNAEKLSGMGKILNEGQRSLREWFETSCTEVDEVTNFCLQSGAVGSRMTGAGWGGYTINLVPSDRVAQFLTSVIDRVGDTAVVEVSPASGGCIYAINRSYGTNARERGDSRSRKRDFSVLDENAADRQTVG